MTNHQNEENPMKPLLTVLAAAALLTTVTSQAGAPKPAHPCYDVADCKTQTSRQTFSACVKANKQEASSNEKCANFRKDKDAWLKEHGVPNLDALFES
jgi:hypothetical protein